MGCSEEQQENKQNKKILHKNKPSKHKMRRVAIEHYHLSQRHASNAKESTVTKK